MSGAQEMRCEERLARLKYALPSSPMAWAMLCHRVRLRVPERRSKWGKLVGQPVELSRGWEDTP